MPHVLGSIFTYKLYGSSMQATGIPKSSPVGTFYVDSLGPSEWYERNWYFVLAHIRSECSHQCPQNIFMVRINIVRSSAQDAKLNRFSHVVVTPAPFGTVDDCSTLLHYTVPKMKSYSVENITTYKYCKPLPTFCYQTIIYFRKQRNVSCMFQFNDPQPGKRIKDDDVSYQYMYYYKR